MPTPKISPLTSRTMDITLIHHISDDATSHRTQRAKAAAADGAQRSKCDGLQHTSVCLHCEELLMTASVEDRAATKATMHSRSCQKPQ